MYKKYIIYIKNIIDKAHSDDEYDLYKKNLLIGYLHTTNFRYVNEVLYNNHIDHLSFDSFIKLEKRKINLKKLLQ